MTLNFRTGAEAAKNSTPVLNPFDDLTLDERHDLVMKMLELARADNVSEQPGYEIVHSCLVPEGRHPNGDRNPSASINYESMIVGCWLCGGSHFLQWVAQVFSLNSSAEAFKFIKESTPDIAFDRPNTLKEMLDFLDRLSNPKHVHHQEPPTYDPSVLDKWKFIHPYLTEWRHIPAQNVVDLTVGYGTLSVRVGDGYVQSDRIIIPHFFKGKLYGWQSRRLGDDGTPKYLCTPDMPRDSTLYNWSVNEEPVVIVESPMSVLTHNHVGHFIATFGAKVTDVQMDLMVRTRSKKIILWFDNDEAGWGAYEHVGDYLMERCRVYAVQSPYVGDPGDLTSSQVEEVLRDHVVPYVLWTRPDKDALVPWNSPPPQETTPEEKDTMTIQTQSAPAPTDTSWGDDIDWGDDTDLTATLSPEEACKLSNPESCESCT